MLSFLTTGPGSFSPSSALPPSLRLPRPRPKRNTPSAPPLQINVRNVLSTSSSRTRKAPPSPTSTKKTSKSSKTASRRRSNTLSPTFHRLCSGTTRADSPAQHLHQRPHRPAQRSHQLLLMDALNTTTQDQAYARQRIVKYLGAIPPGLRIGVFLLGDRLRIIQGFTDDSALLRTSVERLAGNPVAVAMEATPNELASQSTPYGLYPR